MEQFFSLIPLSIMGVGIFLVFRGFNKEGNPNRGGMGSAVYMMGACSIGIVVYILVLTSMDVMFPNLRKDSEWMPAIIAFSVAFIVLLAIVFIDKNSDIYYKNLKKQKIK
jgi:hypothetical protein